MSKYIVIKTFKDLQDNNHIYHEGDSFPHRGREKKARIEELSSNNNKLGTPLIQEIEEGE